MILVGAQGLQREMEGGLLEYRVLLFVGAGDELSRERSCEHTSLSLKG